MTAPKIYPVNSSSIPLFYPAVSKNYLLKSDDIRVTDVWPFLSYTIKVAKHNKKPLKADARNFLLNLLEQAEYFFNTASKAPIKSQPLLYYYSFMNLAKVAINLDSYMGNGLKYNHGINDSISLSTKLSNAELTLWKSRPNSYSVSEYLLKMLEDKPLPYVNTRNGNYFNIKVQDLLRDCVGISKTYCEIYNCPPVFYKLTDVKAYAKARKMYFEAHICECNDDIMTELVSKGYSVTKVADNNYILSANCSVRTTSNPTIAEKHTLSKKLRDIGIWSYLDGDSYKLYISTVAYNLSSAAIIYHIMFFFGSITRYHPDLFDDIISAKENWLVSEFLKTQPIQFLYYMVSKINGSEILMSKQI
jgi:hypothetical protein